MRRFFRYKRKYADFRGKHKLKTISQHLLRKRCKISTFQPRSLLCQLVWNGTCKSGEDTRWSYRTKSRTCRLGTSLSSLSREAKAEGELTGQWSLPSSTVMAMSIQVVTKKWFESPFFLCLVVTLWVVMSCVLGRTFNKPKNNSEKERSLPSDSGVPSSVDYKAPVNTFWCFFCLFPPPSYLRPAWGFESVPHSGICRQSSWHPDEWPSGDRRKPKKQMNFRRKRITAWLGWKGP